MTPADPLNLAHDADASRDRNSGSLRASAASGVDIGAGGQLALLALPGAQLGLDGRWYATEARSAEPLLGPATPSFARDLGGGGSGEAGHPPSPLRGQLALDLADTRKVPQLDLWRRQEVAWSLVDFASRASKCGRCRRKGGDVTGYRDERGRWHWQTYDCRTYACPRCGAKRARAAAANLKLIIDRHLASDGGGLLAPDVWMLTLTLPHGADDGTALTVERLYDAHARFLRSATWKHFVERWSIIGEVRVLDSTFGSMHGAHPHFHIGLFPTKAIASPPCAARPTDAQRALIARAWRGDPTLSEAQLDQAADMFGMLIVDDDDKSPRPMSKLTKGQRQTVLDGLAVELYAAWRAALVAAGVTRAVGGNAVKLSPAEDAADYFVAWGLADEIAATPAKIRSHVRLLDARAAGVAGAGGEYRAFVDAMQGRQWVTGLGDLILHYRVTKADVEAHIAEQNRKRDVVEGNEPLPRIYVTVPASLWSAALSLGWPQIHAMLDGAAVAGVDVQRALLDALHTERELVDARRWRGPPATAPP